MRLINNYTYNDLPVMYNTVGNILEYLVSTSLFLTNH